MGSKVTLSLGALVQMELDAVNIAATGSIRDKLRTACGAVLDSQGNLLAESIEKLGREPDESKGETICATQPKSRMICPQCATPYSHYGAVPFRVFDVGDERLLIPLSEIDEAKAEAVRVDAGAIEKVVPLEILTGEYILRGLPDVPKALVPPKNAIGVQLQQYRLILLALKRRNAAMLTRIKVGGKTHRVAIQVATIKANGGHYDILVAYRVDEAVELPRLPPMTDPPESLVNQAIFVLDSLASDNVTFPPDPDPIASLIESKVSQRTVSAFLEAEEKAKEDARKRLGVEITEGTQEGSK